ncbi:MAG: hypothetical protein V8R17_06960 [Blautia obeum]
MQKMQEEMKKENSLGHGKKMILYRKKNRNRLKKIPVKDSGEKNEYAVLMAAVWWRQPVESGHYWYYDKKNYISWGRASRNNSKGWKNICYG